MPSDAVTWDNPTEVFGTANVALNAPEPSAVTGDGIVATVVAPNLTVIVEPAIKSEPVTVNTFPTAPPVELSVIDGTVTVNESLAERVPSVATMV